MQVQLQDKLSAHFRNAANQVASVAQVYFSKRRAVTGVCILAYAPRVVCVAFSNKTSSLCQFLLLCLLSPMMFGRRLHHERATTFEQSTFTNVDEENIIRLVETNKIH